MKPHVDIYRVRSCECAPDGSLRLPRLLDYLQETAADHARELGFDFPVVDEATGARAAWVLAQLRVRLDAGEDPRAAVRAMRIFPFDKADAVLAGARRLSAAKLRNTLSVCADIDKLYKGLRVPERDSDPWLELKSVVAFLAR